MNDLIAKLEAYSKSLEGPWPKSRVVRWAIWAHRIFGGIGAVSFGVWQGSIAAGIFAYILLRALMSLSTGLSMLMEQSDIDDVMRDIAKK